MAGLLDQFNTTMNNPMMGMALGLLSGKDPGGTFASGAQQGLMNMQGMQRSALEGSFLKSKIEEMKAEEEAKKRWQQMMTPGINPGAQGPQMSPAPGGPQMSPADPGLLSGAPQPQGGLMGQLPPEVMGLLSALPPEQGQAFMAQLALQNMKPTDDRTPADLLAFKQMYPNDPARAFAEWKTMNSPVGNNTVINNIPKPDFGYAYLDPNDPSKGVYTVPGSGVDTKRQDVQKEKDVAFDTYQTSMSGLKDALSVTETGPLIGQVPAFTAAQQTADGAIAATAPVLKQLFRSAGEGVFTDKDQELLMNMIPKRTDLPESRIAKIANIDAIVRAKLGMGGAAPNPANPDSSNGLTPEEQAELAALRKRLKGQ